jgi:pSer/pThr/pTyr-binding forkhead associated (FHA) protein
MPTSFLIVQRGDEIGQRINLDEKRVTVGRNPDNNIVLNDALVSRYHAVLLTDAQGKMTITDLGSTNGVMVNDKVIDPGVPTLLKHRDLIIIGKSVYNLQIRPDGYKASPPPSREDPDITQFMPFKALFS